ncbi:MAG: penicillin-binding protein activator LpoB [Planctomycetota bacterium]|nr:penicillin-binding protein activator LpoB [Planctomycetota bacterium]
MQRFTTLLLLGALAAACSSPPKTRRVDIREDDEAMGTGIESRDVELMAEFSKSLIAHPLLTGSNVEGIPTVAIHPIENNTRFDFDGELFVRRIRQQLVEHSFDKVRFVTRSAREAALIENERTGKRVGEYTTSKQETKTGADFYLTGTASSISKVGRRKESDAIWIDFRLIDAENGEIIWEKPYKTKKIGEPGVVYR